MSLLQQLARNHDASLAPSAAPVPDMTPRRRAIVDIGSNSIRLVVYDGPARAPFQLFNEKVTAGLGAALSTTGRIDDTAMQRGIEALMRFSGLIRAMEVRDVRCIATAAVRDARNGGDFVARARAEAGMEIEILSGDEEGRASGLGVIGAIPGADGIVADLGGGSLELARVRGGEVLKVLSLPLGVLRLAALRERGKDALAKYVARALHKAGWNDTGLPLYMVGGSWRALAHLDMQLTKFPLPVIHHYRMEASRAAYLVRVTAQMGKARLRKIRSIPAARIPTLGNATALLAVLVRELASAELVVSAHGLREGLMFKSLSAQEQALDPLLVATEAEGEAQGRFAGHGRQIDAWIAPLFEADPPAWARLRRAACFLGDVAWRANPDFRAERGVEIALHGNWAGIDGAGRVMLAQALYAAFGGAAPMKAGFERLAGAEALARSTQWGLAIRLAQRLSGGVAQPLEATSIAPVERDLVLSLEPLSADLKGEAVARRLKTLAQAMNLSPRIEPAG
ncbi:exopolyphosphatase [Sphingobium jiangsuense]|uniref:Exopolyphosphatase/guanosine-5'-triphosphate, 3'-diphosphate pyrophosphatase n=1 Tax=Sphingobium jiangsuense TaxID=870476 RepID=A0A7W6BLU7_9SPHN|nr:Ppx/GppA family phosphatase [Sphingobium jiangsuense]MBB3927482.1 exopolyphosphatase/guanosine-5'-triphosphate,3'-diphosphate pyrophosphatase [Sphingobium jiangsuense]GLT00065.1 exopolyphosphatase [Sphingobium jiangsuense]